MRIHNVFKSAFVVALCAAIGWAVVLPVAAQTTPLQSSATNEGSSSTLGAGDFLTFSLKLQNFGSNKRVDVRATYTILNTAKVSVFEQGETVAVDTTASFVKRIQLPADLSPGAYTLEVSILYPGQEVPAVSRFGFTIERRILGIFQSDFVLMCVAVGLGLVIVVLFAMFMRRALKKQSMSQFTYNDKPKDQRIFYEIISNTIQQTRLRFGDRALEIAAAIPHLRINEDTGQVLSIESNPSKIISLLVLRYETLLGNRVDFSVPPSDRRTAELQKNIQMIRKYFE